MDRTDRYWVLAASCGAVVARLVLAAYEGESCRFYDEHDYSLLAQHLLDGRGFELAGSPSAFRAPAQGVFLAMLFMAFGPSVLAARLVQAVLSGAVPWLVFSTGQSLGLDRAWVRAALVLGALNPLLAYASITLYPVTLATVAFSAAAAGVLSLISSRDTHPSLLTATLTGLSLGVLGVATPYLFLLPAVAAWLLRRRALAAVLVASLGLAPTALWVSRNAVVLGAPTLGTHGGYNLALGACDAATPMSGNWIEPDAPALRAAKTELQRDAAFRAAALNWITEHPVRWTALAAGRAVLVLDSVGSPKTAGAGSSARTLLALAFAPLSLLAVVGLVVRRRHPVAQLTLGALLLVALAAAITISKPRFRMPLDPTLTVFALVGLRALLRRQGDHPESASSAPE